MKKFYFWTAVLLLPFFMSCNKDIQDSKVKLSYNLENDRIIEEGKNLAVNSAVFSVIGGGRKFRYCRSCKGRRISPCI